MAMADQNAKGGVTIGGQTYTLADIVRDDKFDQATAKSLANEMVFNDKVPVIFGPSQVEGPAMQQITNDNKILMFCMSPSPDMTKPDYPYNFFAGGIVSQQYDTVLQYIMKYYPNAKKVVTFYADLPDEPLEVGGAQQMCKYYGFDWLGVEKFPMATTDFSPFAQKLIAYNPDIIDLSGGGGATGSLEGTIVTQIRQAGFNGIIMMPTVPPPGIMDTVPKEYLNKIVTNDINIDGPIVSPEYKELVTRYHQQYGEWPIDFFVQAYNAVYPFFQFLNTQNTMDTQQWMENFANYKWTGVFGEQAQWVGKPLYGINRCLMTNFWASEWKDGVLTTDYAPNLPTQLWVGQ
jgi:ABC-type branched-subunit amino acid transport system substrate-binding protein